MEKKIITLNRFFVFSLLFITAVLNGCKKADNFYHTLDDLPQIDNSLTYAYKPSYIVGETMVITGHLDPENNLEISIGGQKATILQVDTFRYQPTSSLVLQKVTIAITEAMLGKAREVKVTTTGGSILGAPIDVYSQAGEGSFSSYLVTTTLASFNTNRNVFLYCINGKGDVYYYAPTDKKLRHISKDGTETELYDLSSPGNTGGLNISNFITGGVNPQGTMLYGSVQTQDGYAFFKINLQSKGFTVLNRSTALTAPYAGNVGTVNMVIAGIYPDSKGNVYLALGINSSGIPDAIANFNETNGEVAYIFKGLGNPIGIDYFPDMPGSATVSSYQLGDLRFSAEEGILYAFYIYQGTEGSGKTIELFDLKTSTRLYGFSTIDSRNLFRLDVIKPLPLLTIGLTPNSPNNSYGYLPMPGRRLQVLLYQKIDARDIGLDHTGDVTTNYDFPRWIVFDFDEERTYAYASGRFRMGGFSFTWLSTAIQDKLLNYDEEGNLYTTANTCRYLIKTQAL